VCQGDFHDDASGYHFVLRGCAFNLCLGSADATLILIEDWKFGAPADAHRGACWLVPLAFNECADADDATALPAGAGRSGRDCQFSRASVWARRTRETDEFV
jgi:hypothetical protein